MTRRWLSECGACTGRGQSDAAPWPVATGGSSAAALALRGAAPGAALARAPRTPRCCSAWTERACSGTRRTLKQLVAAGRASQCGPTMVVSSAAVDRRHPCKILAVRAWTHHAKWSCLLCPRSCHCPRCAVRAQCSLRGAPSGPPAFDDLDWPTPHTTLSFLPPEDPYHDPV